MTRRMLIDAVHPEETRVVIANDARIEEYDFVTLAKQQIKGNIYLAKVTRVEPSLQAAFVEYGGNKQGFLPFAEIHHDYYQIPVSDRQRLLAEVEAMAKDDEEDNEPIDRNSEVSESDFLPPSMEEEAAPAPFPSAQELGSGDSSDFAAQPEMAEDFSIRSEPIDLPLEEPAAQMEHGSNDHFADTENRDPMFQIDPVATEGEPPVPVQGQQEEVQTSEEVETLGEDDGSDSRPRRQFFRRYKIQEVIKRGQVMLVQVIKEERGNKGASVTTYISLAGRYCVLMPNSPKGGGISRKISSGEDRRRLKQISSELKTQDGMSAIIRTAGIDRTRVEIKRDYDYLVKLWNTIRETTLASTAPAMVYEEGDLVKRAIRDLYQSDIEEVLVEGESSYRSAKDFMKMILPSHAPRVKLYKDHIPLFYRYDIEDQLQQMNEPVVRLRSGGYIVMNQTEALIAIDVNSGRSTGERNIEETATKTNLEAAAEVARQLRLRDLAGLIVIDFIDMSDFRHRRSVERALKEALKSDRAKIQIGRISPFGLLEMSRQRLRPSIAETTSMTCPHCQGKGIIRSHASIGIQIIRALEREVSQGDTQELRVMTGSQVSLYLLNYQRNTISEIERQHKVRIAILIDESQMASGYRIEKVKLNGQTITIKDEAREGGRNRRRRRGGRDRNDYAGGDETPQNENVEELNDNIPAEERENDEPREEIAAEGGEDGQRRDRPRRGRRGGRNRRRGGRDRNERGEQQTRPQEGEQPVDEFAEPQDVNGNVAEPVSGEEHPRKSRGGRRNWREEDGGEGGGPRRRGRRGGRRNRERNQNNNGEAPAAAAAAESAPAGDGNFAPQPRYRSDPQPEPAYHAEPASAGVSDNGPSDGDGTKKRGWWRKMVD